MGNSNSNIINFPAPIQMPIQRHGEFSQLLDMIYNAPINMNIWPQFLKKFSAFFNSHFCKIIIIFHLEEAKILEFDFSIDGFQINNNYAQSRFLGQSYCGKISIIFVCEQLNFDIEIEPILDRCASIYALIEAQPKLDTIVKPILKNINHALCITKIDGAILYINEPAKEYFSALKGIDFYKYFLCDFSMLEYGIAISKSLQIGQRFLELKFQKLENNKLFPSDDLVLIQITDISNTSEIFLKEFSQTFNLTKTEFEIVRMFYANLSLKEIARKRNTSYETIKTQIKTIRGKTNTSNLTQLINLINHNKTYVLNNEIKSEIPNTIR